MQDTGPVPGDALPHDITLDQLARAANSKGYAIELGGRYKARLPVTLRDLDITPVPYVAWQTVAFIVRNPKDMNDAGTNFEFSVSMEQAQSLDFVAARICLTVS